MRLIQSRRAPYDALGRLGEFEALVGTVRSPEQAALLKGPRRHHGTVPGSSRAATRRATPTAPCSWDERVAPHSAGQSGDRPRSAELRGAGEVTSRPSRAAFGLRTALSRTFCASVTPCANRRLPR